ncbi:MAG: BMP family ABC transporter substrate-binding protein, partial [Actinobacteria bacterium]|nr:BMP family ABC transporter substrate-binding protein [Actinomycetota bacterium]
MKTTYRALAAVAAAALLATGCGSAPDEGAEPAETSTATEPAADETTDGATEGATEAADADYLACQVTDTGGVDDRSFNQTAYAGLQQAESELGVEIQVLESQSETDFEPNINQFVSQGCDLIVTVGFLLGEATEAAAQANPDTDFAIVDFAYETEYDNL